MMTWNAVFQYDCNDYLYFYRRIYENLQRVTVMISEQEDFG